MAWNSTNLARLTVGVFAQAFAELTLLASCNRHFISQLAFVWTFRWRGGRWRFRGVQVKAIHLGLHAFDPFSSALSNAQCRVYEKLVVGTTERCRRFAAQLSRFGYGRLRYFRNDSLHGPALAGTGRLSLVPLSKPRAVFAAGFAFVRFAAQLFFVEIEFSFAHGSRKKDFWFLKQTQ